MSVDDKTSRAGFVRTNPLVLNGKYAQIIWRSYIESATSKPIVTISGQATGGSGG